jgi:hypothetical protein
VTDYFFHDYGQDWVREVKKELHFFSVTSDFSCLTSLFIIPFYLVSLGITNYFTSFIRDGLPYFLGSTSRLVDLFFSSMRSLAHH